MFEEIKNIKSSNRDLKSFGVTIGIILFTISILLFYYNITSYQIFAFIAFGFVGLGILIPISLKPVYLFWMTFSIILGWIMTKIILTLLFYFLITPIGLVTRLFGNDYLRLKESDSSSYWNNRDSTKELNQSFEKQF